MNATGDQCLFRNTPNCHDRVHQGYLSLNLFPVVCHLPERPTTWATYRGSSHEYLSIERIMTTEMVFFCHKRTASSFPVTYTWNNSRILDTDFCIHLEIVRCVTPYSFAISCCVYPAAQRISTLRWRGDSRLRAEIRSILWSISIQHFTTSRRDIQGIVPEYWLRFHTKNVILLIGSPDE